MAALTATVGHLDAQASTNARTRLSANARSSASASANASTPILRLNLSKVVAIGGSRLQVLAARNGCGAGALVHTVCNGRGHYVYANSKGERQSIFAAAKVEWPQPLLLVLAIAQEINQI